MPSPSRRSTNVPSLARSPTSSKSPPFASIPTKTSTASACASVTLSTATPNQQRFPSICRRFPDLAPTYALVNVPRNPTRVICPSTSACLQYSTCPYLPLCRAFSDLQSVPEFYITRPPHEELSHVVRKNRTIPKHSTNINAWQSQLCAVPPTHSTPST